MKAAASRAFKLKAKRGRRKHEVLHREPNGRASRAKEPPDKVALEARARHLGLKLISAKDPMSATFIGRLHMQYKAWESRKTGGTPRPAESLSTQEYEAAIRYLEIHNDHAKSIQSAGAIYERHGVGSGDEEAHVKWCQKAKERYDNARNAIQEAQNWTRTDNLWAALDLIVLRDEPLSNMIGDLRVLCNALARHFKKS